MPIFLQQMPIRIRVNMIEPKGKTFLEQYGNVWHRIQQNDWD